MLGPLAGAVGRETHRAGVGDDLDAASFGPWNVGFQHGTFSLTLIADVVTPVTQHASLIGLERVIDFQLVACGNFRVIPGNAGDKSVSDEPVHCRVGNITDLQLLFDESVLI